MAYLSGSALKEKKLLVVFGGDGLSQSAWAPHFLGLAVHVFRADCLVLRLETADVEHRNIASVVEWVRSEMGLPLLAVACDLVAKQWGGVDAHVDYVSIHCPWLIRPALLAVSMLNQLLAAQQACYYPEQKDPATGETIWGGVGPDGAPIGGSAYYLARTIGNALGGVIAIAGGEVSAAEIKYVLERESSAVAPVAFIRAEAAQPYVSKSGSVDTDRGPLDSLLDAYVAAGRLPSGGPPAFATLNTE